MLSIITEQVPRVNLEPRSRKGLSGVTRSLGLKALPRVYSHTHRGYRRPCGSLSLEMECYRAVRNNYATARRSVPNPAARERSPTEGSERYSPRL